MRWEWTAILADILWSPGLQVVWSIGLNKTKLRKRLGISTFNSLLTVQFNVPQKRYELKPNTELLKTCVNAMNTL